MHHSRRRLRCHGHPDRLCGEVPARGSQVHDANIVATMLAAGELRLLTFNSADFRRYGDRLDLVDLR